VELSDGSVVRGDESIIMPAWPLQNVPGVQWKDVVYDAVHDLSLRMYKPPAAAVGEGRKLHVTLCSPTKS
jgi:hypothetical protein